MAKPHADLRREVVAVEYPWHGVCLQRLVRRQVEVPRRSVLLPVRSHKTGGGVPWVGNHERPRHTADMIIDMGVVL